MAKPQSTYSQLLLDPRWQKKRLEILSRDEFTCQICFDGESTLHVHHKHYVKGRKPWEYEAHELVTLCESCHSQQDDLDMSRKDLLARLNVDGPYCVSDGLTMLAGWASHKLGDTREVWVAESPLAFHFGELIAMVQDALAWNINDVLEMRDALGLISDDEKKMRLLDMAAEIRKAHEK